MQQEFLQKLLEIAKKHSVKHEGAHGKNDEFTKDQFEHFIRDIQVIKQAKLKPEIA